jgi:hypothetical protein
LKSALLPAPSCGGLSEAVGPTGQVLAIDLDTRLLQGVDAANVEVRVQDLLGDAGTWLALTWFMSGPFCIIFLCAKSRLLPG